MALRAGVLLLVALVLAGCAAPEPADDASPASSPEPQTPALRMLALDGRWAFPAATAASVLARVNATPPLGELVLLEARGARALADVAGLDEAAARTLGVDVSPAGEAFVSEAYAAREGLEVGAWLPLAAERWPAPYVATYFEMERTTSCERRPDAKLCFLPEQETGTARLRLTADPGARDAGFLPDLVELGPMAKPAWWNGTFVSPSGNVAQFQAHASLDGVLTSAEFPGAMEPGRWVVSFRLEARGQLAPSGAAGIVRIREPGYLWFDDRLQEVHDPIHQARAVLANASPASMEVRVARIVPELPAHVDVQLAYADARALAQADGPTAVLASLTPAQERAMGALRATDGVSTALRPRALPAAPERAPPAGPTPGATSAIVLAAPAGLDLSTLPPVEGAHAPSLALAGRAPVGEPIELDGRAPDASILLLAHAEGAVPWTLPAGGRWSEPAQALDNLSRSRTLALSSPDLLSAAIATMRVEMGEGNTTRSMVAIGGVEGGPAGTLWTSAALVAGAGHPVSARLVVPLAPGADRDQVVERVLLAWGPSGVVLDRP